MAEFIVSMCLLFVGFIVLSFIGHLCWLGLAKLVRLLFYGTGCKVCGQPLDLNGLCAKCAQGKLHGDARSSLYQPIVRTPTPQEDLAAAQRLVQYIKFRQWLPDTEHQWFEACLQRLSQRLTTTHVAPTSTPIPFSLVPDDPASLAPQVPIVEVPIVEASTVAPSAAELLTAQAFTAAHQILPANQISVASGSVADLPTAQARAVPAALAVHPLDQIDPPESQPNGSAAASGSAANREPLSADILRSFMERSNIRWVELVSAALVVVCSVGLVISLWSTLSRTSRFFPSLVFMVATLAVHGAGQYTLKRWKLRTTSRGILHIGLMLIPLSVLVGILLSHRGDLPEITPGSSLAVLIGAGVYGALALTASRSLFSRHCWPTALLTLCASLTLIPVYFYAARGISPLAAAGLLLPLIMLSAATTLGFSRHSIHRFRWTPAFARRHMGMVVQALFAIVIACVFSFLQFRTAQVVSPWWWTLVGFAAVGWSGWAWVVSLSRLTFVWGPTGDYQSGATELDATELAAAEKRAGQSEVRRGSDASWMIVSAWIIGLATTLFLVASGWQASVSRASLIVLLAAAALWWTCQGALCRLALSLVIGMLAGIVAVAIGSESLHAQIAQFELPPLSAIDWISFERIAWLTATGAVVAGGAMFGLTLSQSTSTLPGGVSGSPRLWPRGKHGGLASRRLVCEQASIAGGLSILAGAALTIVATCTSAGATPYGGNWAPISLAIYGIAITAAGIVMEQSQRKRWLIPLGQAITILATVRLCQSSSLMPEWIVELRPGRAWAIGLSLLAAAWSIVAVTLLQIGRTSRLALELVPDATGKVERTGLHAVDRGDNNPLGWLAIDWLCSAAWLLATLSAFAIWRTSDRLELASVVGWTLPIVAVLTWWACKGAVLRELAMVTGCLWLCACLFTFGDDRQWWSELGPAASVASHALICIAACGLFVAFWKFMQPPRWPAWATGGDLWSVPTLLTISLSAIIISTAFPAIAQLSLSLGMVIDYGTTDDPSWPGRQRPGDAATVCLLSAIAFIVPVSAYASRLPNLLWLRTLLSCVPLSGALTGAAWSGTPLAPVISAWILGGSLLLSEVIALAGNRWREQSTIAWECQVESTFSRCALQFQWLAIGRALTFAALIALSTVAVVQAWRGLLPSELLPAVDNPNWLQASSISRVGTLLAWLGPLLAVLLVRWSLSVIGDALPRLANLSAALAALTTACLCSLIVTAPTDLWVLRSVTLLQAAAATVAILAGLTLAYALSRNFIALNALAQGQTPWLTLLTKSSKGRRWKRAETCSWSLIAQGLAVLTLLCFVAAATIVWSPIEILPTVAAVASWPSWLAYATVLPVFIMLGRGRAVSRFAMLAVALGLLAPLVANIYAEWLQAAPSRRSLTANGFEPYRAQLILWIVALGIGLCVRIGSRGRTLAVHGEVLWVALALLVGGLALISTSTDREIVWPAGILSALAAVTVLSSLASGHSWRGHVAAATAAAAIVTFQFVTSPARLIESMWLMLWGPIWVAGLAVAWVITQQWTNRARGVAVNASDVSRAFLPSVDQTVSIHVPITISLASGLWISTGAWHDRLEASPWIAGLAAAALALAIARLWDWRSGQRGLAVYLATISASLTTAVMVVAVNDLPFMESGLLWMAAGLAALALMAGCLREWMRESTHLLPALRLGALEARSDEFSRARQWMVPLHCTIGLCLLVPSCLLVVNFHPQSLRLATSALPFLSAVCILPIAIDAWWRVPRIIGLMLISCAAILFSWSNLRPIALGLEDVQLWGYFQRTFVALVILSWAYAGLSEPLRFKIDWQWILHRAGWLCLALGCTAGILLLAGAWGDGWKESWSGTPLGTKVFTLAAWSAVVVRLLKSALAPRGLDCSASITTRQAAVYAAELALAMFSAAAYFSFPDLFAGIFARWWPLVVFGIAMLSAAIGHWSARAGHHVIADPVRRSSLLLTLIPLMIVWWPNVSNVGIDWSDGQRFSLLLLIAASLYGLHAWLRPSIGLVALSLALTLLSYWSLLHSRPNLRFFEHPQFWLLPPAIATIMFVESNRRRLNPSVVIAARYCAILVAYLSSTAELLLKAFEGQMWQPLVLLALAVVGVLAGIALRVRAFLYCGAAFVLVALLGMVWHAQQAIDQVWPWWAFGILTGVCLIAMLGYFEKNRPRVLAYLEQLKSWEH